MHGYYRYPTLHKDTIIFAADSDLWRVPLKGGRAERLTSALSSVEAPHFSPDGKWIAFTGYEEGHNEVYRIPSEGGQPQRLTFMSMGASVVGWTKEGHIIFTATRGLPVNLRKLFNLDPQTKTFKKIPCGPANAISYGPDGKANVIQRHGYGYVSWKRYRGGTAAQLWVDKTGKGDYTRLNDLTSNTLCPLWIEGRIYFISDHEGHGNIYSSTPDGTHLKRLTSHQDYFVRNLQYHNGTIVYSAGGDLHALNLKTLHTAKIHIAFHTSAPDRARKFVSASRYLTRFDVNASGEKLAVINRGRPFSFANWEGAVSQHGTPNGIRYRHINWLFDGKRMAVICDRDGSDHIEIHDCDPLKKIKPLKKMDLGRITSVEASPTEDRLLCVNHRCEVFVVDLKAQTLIPIDRSEYGEIQGMSWSPDGNWVVYSCPLSRHRIGLKLAHLKTGKVHQITDPIRADLYPHFEGSGKYIYFTSKRLFNPVADNMQFDKGFPQGMKPYLITLQKDTLSPFEPRLKGECKEEKSKKKSKAKTPFKIDLDGIQDRIIEFPVGEGSYGMIFGVKGKAIYAVLPEVEDHEDDNSGRGASLKIYDFSQQKEESFVSGVVGVTLSLNREWIGYSTTKGRVRVIKSGEKPQDSDHSYKKGGWIDLSRIKCSVDPGAEWKQIFDETWRLQRDFFWDEKMSHIDWDGIYKRYVPLVERVCTREELSDLISEMHGELGSSHAYVFGGESGVDDIFPQGELGADFTYNKTLKGWAVSNVTKGDIWDPKSSSPLSAPGVNLDAHDVIVAINGQVLEASLSPDQVLVNQAGSCVDLTLKNGKETRVVTVKTLLSSRAARYRDWVNHNKEYVHKKTKGRVGYLHIPDMSTWGYAEFHRNFLTEIDRDGLIVDVRFNGGGNVSQILLSKLARKRLGFDQTRWFGRIPYPEDSPPGPMAALTNEYAGSDGDMFSHCFKLMGLGPLIGKRTWGGVIGIWPRHSQLVDGGVTTQPEFSFWFHDVGWAVENYGTDPDIEVEITPQDYEAERDPQLDRGIKEVMASLKTHKPFEETPRPNLRAKKLPKM